MGKMDEIWIEMVNWPDSVRNTETNRPHPMAQTFYHEREELIHTLLELEIKDKHKKIKEEEEAKLQEETDKREHESASAALRDPILAAIRRQGGWSEQLSADEVVKESFHADTIEKCLEAASQVYEASGSGTGPGADFLDPRGNQLKVALRGALCSGGSSN